MVRTNQGGSILSFIIIGSVLALLLVGGAYLVRTNFASSEQASEEIASAPDDKNGDEQPAESQSESKEDEGDQSPRDEAAEPQKDDQPAESKDELSAEKPLPTTGYQGGDDTPGSLPQTGAGSTFLGTIMLAGLAALIVAYARSRALASRL